MVYCKSKEILFFTAPDVAIHAFGLTEDGFDDSRKVYMRGHKRAAKGLLLLEDQGILLSGGSDYGIKVWNLEDLSLKYVITASNERHSGA